MQLPTDYVTDRKVTLFDLQTYGAMWSFADWTKRVAVRVTMKGLCEVMGIDYDKRRTQVIRSQKRLVELGYLERMDGGGWYFAECRGNATCSTDATPECRSNATEVSQQRDSGVAPVRQECRNAATETGLGTNDGAEIQSLQNSLRISSELGSEGNARARDLAVVLAEAAEAARVMGVPIRSHDFEVWRQTLGVMWSEFATKLAEHPLSWEAALVELSLATSQDWLWYQRSPRKMLAAVLTTMSDSIEAQAAKVAEPEPSEEDQERWRRESEAIPF